MTARLSLSVDDHVGVLRLERPPVNAFDAPFKRELVEACAAIAAEPDLRAVVLHGGERFSAGDDIKELHTDSPDDAAAGLVLISRACTAVASLAVPVVAAVRGLALGGGCELALAADFRVSSPEARWGLPEVHLGLIPSGGGTQRLARLIGAGAAKRMVYLGEPVSGTRAHELGLVDVLAPDPDVLAVALDLARELAARAPLALRAAKTAIDRGLSLPLADGLAVETEVATGLVDTDDARAGLASFLDDGPGRARFTGR